MDSQKREQKENDKQSVFQHQRYKINYCPFCGAIINQTEYIKKQNNICLSCKKNMTIPFDLTNDLKNNFLVCNNCAFLNPLNVNFCAKCGSDNLSLTITQAPSKTHLKDIRNPFFRSRKFYYIISFFISLAISTCVVVFIASKYIIVKNIIAVIIILSFAFILSMFFFVIISTFAKEV
ncbi:MAG: hypothetical protein EAX90_11115 [Candidatus Heimdallarchaeota archaeon]|nr:hypothetical protein [Candidatus Heimdallarchaeota archaeon]